MTGIPLKLVLRDDVAPAHSLEVDGRRTLEWNQRATRLLIGVCHPAPLGGDARNFRGRYVCGEPRNFLGMVI